MALVHLVGRLIIGGYRLLDTQFINEHLAQFGVREIPREAYHDRLEDALAGEGDFYALGRGARAAGADGAPPAAWGVGTVVLQAISQAS